MSTPECRKDCDVYADWQKMEGDTAGHLLDIARLQTKNKGLKARIAIMPETWYTQKGLDAHCELRDKQIEELKAEITELLEDTVTRLMYSSCPRAISASAWLKKALKGGIK